MAFIRIIQPDEAEGTLATTYEEVAGRRGAVSNVLKVHSLKPETMRTHLDLYMSILYSSSGLTRQEREAVAVAVSRANGCTYCVRHHADAYDRYQKDPRVVKALADQGFDDALTPRERALIEYAVTLTTTPGDDPSGRVARLREAGFDDEEILTATMTTAYFNFVNRMVHGLGVELEGEKATYKY